MKKRIFGMLLAGAMMLSLAACGSSGTGSASPSPSAGAATESAAPTGGIPKDQLKVGVVLVGEENDNGYNYNHVVGIQEMQKEYGLTDDQIIYKTNVHEDASCDTALRELAEAGCQIIFCNSFGHEPYMVEVAADYPDIQFCHATGYISASDDKENTHNYFTSIYQARYLTGIAAGLKAKQIGNSKLGYVAAKPFAEVISGFTAFYLGAKSVYPDVTMEVMYTNEWSDATLEAQVAKALIDDGCGVISQHSDTTAPATTAEANGAFQVGYNADMISAAPHASLVSARVDWGVYYKYAVGCMLSGEAISQDWCQGLKEGAVYLSPLNDAIVAPGTADAIETAKAKIISGEIHVFDGPLTGTDADGKTLDLKQGEYYHESEQASAPSFDYIIPGVTVVK